MLRLQQAVVVELWQTTFDYYFDLPMNFELVGYLNQLKIRKTLNIVSAVT